SILNVKTLIYKHLFKMNTKTTFIILVLIYVSSFVASLYLFYPFKLSFSNFLPSIVDIHGKTLDGIILYNIRLPRSIMCLLAGMALSTAGLLLQALVRNPIASPTILGINSGCILAMVVISTGAVEIFTRVNLTLGAALGGVLAWLIVMTISYSPRGFNKSKLILAGITVSLLLMSISRIIIIFNDDRALSILSWIAGSFNNIQWNDILNNVIFSLPCFTIVILLSHKLNILLLNDESVKSLGLNLKALKVLICILALLLTASSVSIVGTIGFVGLLSPHIAAYLVGIDNRKKIFASILIGGILTLVSDTLSRAIFFPAEIPAGLIVALIGAPYFLYIAIRKI
ncbi:FecCD family ABC transporter permease, partial [Psittacicella gerlachiana]